MMAAETIGAAARVIRDRVQAPLAGCGHVKHGRFPKPLNSVPRLTAWRVEEIRALIAQPGQ
jgi:hypothetical protein